MSDSYGSLGYLQLAAPNEIWPKAKAAAQAALKIDDTLAEAHAALGHATMTYDWNFPKAKEQLERAIQLNPKHAVARHWYAHYLFSAGNNFPEALAESQRAVELEPLDLMLNAHLLFYEGGPGLSDQLLAHIRRVREIEPDFWAAHTTLGIHYAYAQKGMFKEAIEEARKGANSSNRFPLALAWLGNAYALAGQKQNAEQVIVELRERSKQGQYVPSFFVAWIYASLGKLDEAFTWLERGFQERDSGLLDLKGYFDPWKSDPRFQSLVRRIGLPR